VPDPLYLSLWFPSFVDAEMLPHALAVLQQFPFSQQRPGVTYLSLHPVSWDQATLFERRFVPGIDPEQATLIAAEHVHDDFAYVFEAYWDLWAPNPVNQSWSLAPAQVKFIVQGKEFADGTSQETGHIEIDFGPETPFLHEELKLTSEAESKVRANVQRLVEFTIKVEKNTQARGRLLWSESEDNLAQKLIARLQKVQ